MQAEDTNHLQVTIMIFCNKNIFYLAIELFWSQIVTVPDEFFTVYTKLAEMAISLLTCLRIWSDAEDYYWFKSPTPNQLT